MRGIYLLLLVSFISIGSWWFYKNHLTVQQIAKDYSWQESSSQPFLALEAYYTPAQIVEIHREQLPQDRKQSAVETALRFFPYLLLDVAHAFDENSSPGVILWSMEDGEIIVNTASWETSEGFAALLSANATQNDYLIVQALAAKSGNIEADQLIKKLGVDALQGKNWLAIAKDKGFISQNGNFYELNIPLKIVEPATHIHQRLVTKPYNHVRREATRYSKEQIREAARFAFTPQLTIRSEREVFLPVYSVSTTHLDGSIQTTYWNGLNGQKYIPGKKL